MNKCDVSDISPILDCRATMHCKSHLSPVTEGLDYRHQAGLQEGVSKGYKGSDQEGLHQMSILSRSSLSLIFPCLVLGKLLKAMCILCDSKKKRVYCFLSGRMQLRKSGENPNSLLQILFFHGVFQMRHREKLLITIYVRPIGDNKPKSFLSLLNGYCAKVPQPQHAVEHSTQLP